MIALALTLLALGVAAFGLAAVEMTPDGLFMRWFRRLPYPGLAQAGTARTLYLAGVAVVMLGTANGVVRSLLALVAPRFATAEKRLRGGRFIGALERLLIFGLAAAGEPTAAVIVASAKSLLRFPELSSTARVESDASGGPSLDELTEYLVLGSLASWSLALLPLILL